MATRAAVRGNDRCKRAERLLRSAGRDCMVRAVHDLEGSVRRRLSVSTQSEASSPLRPALAMHICIVDSDFIHVGFPVPTSLTEAEPDAQGGTSNYERSTA
jgi:hypothetical protein